MNNRHTIDPDITGLKEFSHEADRELSPFFTGRHEESKRVLQQIELCVKRHHEQMSTAGRTMLITGPPGIGKSAFLQRLATHAPHCYGDTQIIPAAVNLNPLHSEQNLNQQITRAINKEKSPLRLILEAVGDKLPANVGKTIGLPESLDNTLRTIGKQIMEHTKTVPVVCVLIDEIQTATEANGPTLRQLHTQEFSPPILPVFAGLSNAPSVLDDIGISRYSDEAHIRLGRLAQEHAQQAVHQLFGRYHVQGSDKNKAALALFVAKNSQGFPQHLHVGLKGVARMLAESGGMLSNESHRFSHQMAQAEQAAKQRRHLFYASKMTGELHKYRHSVIDIIHKTQRTKNPLEQEHLIAWAHHSMRQRSPLEQKPTQDDAVALIQKMHRRGVLELTPEGRAEVPIPSMRTWLTGEYAKRCHYNAPNNTQDSGIPQ